MVDLVLTAKMKRPFIICLLAAVFSWQWSSILYGQAKSLITPMETNASGQIDGADNLLVKKAGGLLGSTLEYGRAWKSGDVLVKVRRSFDSVDRPEEELDLEGTLVESTEYFRVAFDFPTGRLLVVRYARSSELDLQRQKDGLESKRQEVSLTGACIDGDNNISQLETSGTFKHLKGYFRGFNYPGDLSLRFGKINFPDLRMFFLAGDTSPTAFAAAETLIGARGKESWKLVNVQDKGEDIVQIEYQYSTEKDAPNWAAFSEIWEIDPRTLVPVKLHYEISRSNGSQNQSGASVSFEWTEVNGIQVLKSYEKIDKKGRHVVGVSQLEGVMTINADFHWFGLNHEVNPSLFDGLLIKDTKTALEHVDPLKCGADSLVATNRKELDLGVSASQGK